MNPNDSSPAGPASTGRAAPYLKCYLCGTVYVVHSLAKDCVAACEEAVTAPRCDTVDTEELS